MPQFSEFTFDNHCYHIPEHGYLTRLIAPVTDVVIAIAYVDNDGIFITAVENRARIDRGEEKLIPLDEDFMETLKQWGEEEDT